MENKNIVVILIVIIIILASAIGFMVLKPMHAKEPTKIKISSNKTLTEGNNLSLQLTDFNKTPLSKEIVNITITDSKGKVVVDDVVKTDSKGKASLNLNLKKGKYNVTVSYGGNENFTGNNTTQKLTIKEKVVEASNEVKQNTETSNTKTSSENSQSNFHNGESHIGPNGLEYGRFYDDAGREYIYEDRGGYVNVLDDQGNGVSVDYDGNVVGTHNIHG